MLLGCVYRKTGQDPVLNILPFNVALNLYVPHLILRMLFPPNLKPRLYYYYFNQLHITETFTQLTGH